MKIIFFRKNLLILSLIAPLFSHPAAAEGPFTNLKEIQQKLGFSAYYQAENRTRPVKVAILDSGFKGFKSALGKTLPINTIYHLGPVAPIKGTEEIEHGRVMAEIAYLLMTDSGRNLRFAPSEFHLYNVSGFSNFKAAIDDTIKRGIDVVIYSEVWQLGGNWDGNGFINGHVKRATDAGILWVNAAGNFGHRTFQSRIQTVADDWVKLPDASNALHVRCTLPKEIELKKCTLRATLSWNDFKDDERLGTDKDLDFGMTDDLGNIKISSTMKQSLDSAGKTVGSTNYPRESISIEIDPGLYFLKVKNRSKNFGASDSFRIVVDGDFLTVPSGQVDESLLNPADNPNVITVGASDSERSSVSVSLAKPEISSPSQIIFAADQRDMRGTSNSAAIVGAGIAMLKALMPNATRSEILDVLNRSKPFSGMGDNVSSSLSSFDLRFGPARGGNCFAPLSPQDLNLRQWPVYFSQALSAGGVVVATSHGVKIMVPFDPAGLHPSLRRWRNDDLVAVGPYGYFLQPRQAMYQLGPGHVEIFQKPYDLSLCNQHSVRDPQSGVERIGNDAGSFYLPEPESLSSEGP